MAGRTVFADTGYFLAIEIENDQYHRAAVRHWEAVARDLPTMVITSYVFGEIITHLNSRRLHSKAIELGRRLLSSPSIHLIHVDETLFWGGWSFFQQHQDKDYSLTDCISFVVMRRFVIATAFTFDRHFIQAGFAVEP